MELSPAKEFHPITREKHQIWTQTIGRGRVGYAVPSISSGYPWAGLGVDSVPTTDTSRLPTCNPPRKVFLYHVCHSLSAFTSGQAPQKFLNRLLTCHVLDWIFDTVARVDNPLSYPHSEAL